MDRCHSFRSSDSETDLSSELLKSDATLVVGGGWVGGDRAHQHQVLPENQYINMYLQLD